MGYFRYKLITPEGILKGGLINLPFDSPVSAMTYLERQGGTVIMAEPVSRIVGMLYAFVQYIFEDPVKPPDLIELLNNVAIMLKAGISLVMALKDIFAANENKTIARIGEDLVQRIEAGASFSEAASQWPRFFSSTTVFLFRIGEETGGLDKTVKDASEHIHKMYRIKKDTQGALIYPSIMFLVIGIATFFWLYFVVPMMMPMFKSMNFELPPLTVWVIGASEFLQENGQLILISFIAFIIVFKIMLKRIYRLRYGWHWFLLKMPVSKQIINASNLAFITEYFNLLLRSGIDVLKSLEILSESMNNEVYKAKMKIVKDTLVQGSGLRDAFAAGKVFPPFIVRMISVGEQSGQLTDQLGYASEEYAQRLTDLTGTLSKLIQPIALVIGGGIFIVLIIAMFLPLYQMTSGMG